MYYNNLSDYYKKKFGSKVVKLSFKENEEKIREVNEENEKGDIKT